MQFKRVLIQRVRLLLGVDLRQISSTVQASGDGHRRALIAHDTPGKVQKARSINETELLNTHTLQVISVPFSM